MAQSKTKPAAMAVEDFIAALAHPGKRADAAVLDALFRKVSGAEPVMWGPSIIGYGKYRYRYDSGREGEMCRIGFSPRKAKHSLYVHCTCDGPAGEAVAAILARLGKHAQGQGGCIYVNKLADVDPGVLEELLKAGWRQSHSQWPD